MDASILRGLSVRDIRFPNEQNTGKYACAYVILYTDTEIRGYGLTFAFGRGNEFVVQIIKKLSGLIVGKSLKELFLDFGQTWINLRNETELNWVGPEKGVAQLAVAAMVNALFDLWSRLSHRPLWKLLVDMDPEKLVGMIDFTFINDVLSKDEAIQILYSMRKGSDAREKSMVETGYPTYLSIANTDDIQDLEMEERCKEYIVKGWKHVKLKVGSLSEVNKRRSNLIRNIIGPHNHLILDSKQLWSQNQAIENIVELKDCKPLWIEDPTNPDDVFGHLNIRKAVNSHGMKIAAGKTCQSKIILKQYLHSNAIDICQIDSCRLGGVPEALAIYLMAKKFNIPVVPYSEGVGQVEMAQHLQIWDYIAVSGSKTNRMIECVDLYKQQHLKYPIRIKNHHLLAPNTVGYSSEMWTTSVADYEYPIGPAWKKLFDDGVFINPRRERPQYVASMAHKNVIKNR